MNLIEFIKNDSEALYGKGASEEAVKDAQEKLNLVFSKDYIDYLQEFGTVAINGHELTGISNDERTNVTNNTIEMKNLRDDDLKDYYVVEKANIDSIIIWQTETGEIFETIGMAAPVKIGDSLMDYLEKY